MSQVLPFGEIVEAADHLSLEEQQTLVSILQHRLAQAGRQRCAADIAEARREFAEGMCRPTSTTELIDEIFE